MDGSEKSNVRAKAWMVPVVMMSLWLRKNEAVVINNEGDLMLVAMMMSVMTLHIPIIFLFNATFVFLMKVLL